MVNKFLNIKNTLRSLCAVLILSVPSVALAAPTCNSVAVIERVLKERYIELPFAVGKIRTSFVKFWKSKNGETFTVVVYDVIQIQGVPTKRACVYVSGSDLILQNLTYKEQGDKS